MEARPPLGTSERSPNVCARFCAAAGLGCAGALLHVGAGASVTGATVAAGPADARDEDGELSLFDRLSEREMQIAMMVVDCQKVQDISDKLCLSPKTVNSYRYRIFEKLEISSDVELALMAVRLGLLDADKV